MYKVSEYVLKEILDALEDSNKSFKFFEHEYQEVKYIIEKNQRIIRLIKDNYLLDGE